VNTGVNREQYPSCAHWCLLRYDMVQFGKWLYPKTMAILTFRKTCSLHLQGRSDLLTLLLPAAVLSNKSSHSGCTVLVLCTAPPYPNIRLLWLPPSGRITLGSAKYCWLSSAAMSWVPYRPCAPEIKFSLMWQPTQWTKQSVLFASLFHRNVLLRGRYRWRSSLDNIRMLTFQHFSWPLNVQF
jgi:hypothetical protein